MRPYSLYQGIPLQSPPLLRIIVQPPCIQYILPHYYILLTNTE